MARRVCKTVGVMTGTQLRTIRESKAMTQAQVAAALGMEPGKGGKLVSSWEHLAEVPRLREAELWRLFFPERADDPLAAYSDGRLFAEVHARLAELQARVDMLRQATDRDHASDDPDADSDESSTIPPSDDEAAAPHRKAATGWGSEGGATST